MQTNAKVQKALELVHTLSGDLLEKSKDGKIELAELAGTAVLLMPLIVDMLGDTTEGK